ncbi:hypothetical protein J8L70_02385 [Pseudoalteromonas sp. MMG010]|uniref:surface lipoprotein assembly modifier n=1 Tax=Pseudoalteromonas sp. MMG010 TaxID=2822685 RepID=UPI001B3A64D0|nr:surface lipoprotein assembly modifier [Pseudoalteromonas sp. MMG010]MBQ4832081.1 hypothetical protein [Pseudoalteromonas sp. MMG010]
MKLFFKLSLISAFSTSCYTLALQSDYSAVAEVGLTNNSDLAIKELDVISSQSDSGNTLSLALSSNIKFSDTFKITPSYRYEKVNYQTLDQYDLTLHQYGVDSNVKRGNTDFGIRYDGATAKVANETFLRLNQASLYAGHFISATTYIRASLNTASKTFLTQPARDSNNVGVNSSLYYFMNQGNTLLLIGAKIEKEQAEDSQYDFKGYGINTKLSHKFTALNLSNEAGIGWSYNNKDYHETNPASFTEPTLSRDEKRNVFNAFWQLNVIDSISIVAEAEYGDYSSKTSSNTYTQSVTSLSLKAEF